METTPCFKVMFCIIFLAETGLRTHGISCYQKCFRDLHGKRKATQTSSTLPTNSIQECLKHCTRDKELSMRNIQVLGPKDKVPDNLHMPKRIPPMPGHLAQGKSVLTHKTSECDSTAIASEDQALPGHVEIVSVSCQPSEKGEPRLVVEWKKPKDGSQFLTGYQIFYRFANAHSMMDKHCQLVDKEATEFVINKKLGLLQGPISLGVKALPTKSKYRLKLQMFKGCGVLSGQGRIKRSLNTLGFAAPDVANKSVKTEILWPGDQLPTGLVMPTQGYRPPLGRFEQNRTCGAPMLERRTTPILDVSDLRLSCEGGDETDGKIGYAQWSMTGIPTDKYVGFQVLYSVMLDRNYDPTKTFCVEVGPGVRSVLIDKGLRSDIKVRLNVAPLPIYSGQQLELNTYYCTRPSPDLVPPADNSPPLGGIFGGVAAVVAVAAAFATWILRRHKGGTTEVRAADTPGPMAYFSHCYRSKKDVKRLLIFADRLTSNYAITCCIDLLEQRVIDTMTLSVWCNARLAESDKIIVVVDKKYLKTWDQHVKQKKTDSPENDVEACKVLNDLYYIQQHLMERIERTAKVICLLTDGVQRTELPDFLRRRPVLNWPSNDEGMADFVRCIKGLENNVLSL